MFFIAQILENEFSDQKICIESAYIHALRAKVKTFRILLFLLMTILSQSFLTLVRSHLVAFSFLSAGHNFKYYSY